MSDEIRADEEAEVEAHGGGVVEGGVVEGGVIEGGTMEAVEDDDFEAHGGFVEGGVVENVKNIKTVAE
jgi:hypothetical protein